MSRFLATTVVFAVALVAAFAAPAAPMALPKPEASIEGYYACTGTTSAGDDYDCVVMIRQLDDRYRVTWATAGGVLAGVGMRDGDKLTVGWSAGSMSGLSQFTIDTSGPKPSLSGRWIAGGSSGGEETLAFLRKFTPRE